MQPALRAAPAGLRPRRPDSEGPARWRAENSAGALRVCVLRASYADSPSTVEESSIRIPVPAGPKSRLAAVTFRTQPSGRRSQPRASFRRWWRAEHEARHLEQKTQARAWASPGASHSTAHAHNAAIMHTAEQHMMRKPTAACAQHSMRALPRLAGGPLHDWHTARGTAHECPDDLRDACSGVHGCLVLYPANTNHGLHRRAMAGAHGYMTSNGIARAHPSVCARCMHTNYCHVDAHVGRQIHAHARTVSCAPSPSSTSH